MPEASKAPQEFRAVENLPDIFRSTRQHAALSIPAQRTAELRKALAPLLYHQGKHIVKDPHNPQNRRLLVLQEIDRHPNPEDAAKVKVTITTADGNDDNNEEVTKKQQAARTSLARIIKESDEVYMTTYEISIDYSNLSVHQVLSKLLPKSTTTEFPSSFELVGHIAHMNLRDELLPYKYWIGKVILDKNPAIKTVVNKVGAIENEYRVFENEVIAGSAEKGWSLVLVKEEGCVFELDFVKVYWNSRLAGEHHRIVQSIRARASAAAKDCTTVGSATTIIVADLMAGVGPFAVPLTSTTLKSKTINPSLVVHANDLNPDSYKYLVINSKRNKCRNLQCYNMDARRFVHQVVEAQGADVVLMNLPASAPEFLDAFRGFSISRLPLMHVYCFAPKDEEESGYPQAIQRCQTSLGIPLKDVSVRTVRNVSPSKNMVCVVFPLPRAVSDLPKISFSSHHQMNGSPSETNEEPKGPLALDFVEPDAKRLKKD